MIVIAGIVTVALLAPCLTTLRAALRLHREKVTPEGQIRGKKISRSFGLVFAVEFVAIAMANLLLSLFNYPEFIDRSGAATGKNAHF